MDPFSSQLIDNQSGAAAGAPGPQVPHAGMAGGVLGIVLIMGVWLYVQHRQMGESTAVPRLGLVMLTLTYLSLWILERGTRAAQTRWPGVVTDFFAI